MDITRRCDYALRILRVAYDHQDTFISVADIAEREDIPYAFARSIQHDLVRAGLLHATRGAHGGLVLNCDPHQTTIAKVVEAVDGPITIAVCTAEADICDKQQSCNYHSLWKGANHLLNDYFSSVTLADILEQGEDNAVVQAALEYSFGDSCKPLKA